MHMVEKSQPCSGSVDTGLPWPSTWLSWTELGASSSGNGIVSTRGHHSLPRSGLDAWLLSLRRHLLPTVDMRACFSACRRLQFKIPQFPQQFLGTDISRTCMPLDCHLNVMVKLLDNFSACRRLGAPLAYLVMIQQFPQQFLDTDPYAYEIPTSRRPSSHQRFIPSPDPQPTCVPCYFFIAGFKRQSAAEQGQTRAQRTHRHIISSAWYWRRFVLFKRLTKYRLRTCLGCWWSSFYIGIWFAFDILLQAHRTRPQDTTCTSPQARYSSPSRNATSCSRPKSGGGRPVCLRRFLLFALLFQSFRTATGARVAVGSITTAEASAAGPTCHSYAGAKQSGDFLHHRPTYTVVQKRSFRRAIHRAELRGHTQYKGKTFTIQDLLGLKRGVQLATPTTSRGLGKDAARSLASMPCFHGMLEVSRTPCLMSFRPGCQLGITNIFGLLCFKKPGGLSAQSGVIAIGRSYIPGRPLSGVGESSP